MTASTYTTFYLEMTSPLQLNRKAVPAALNIVECEVPQFEFNRFLYELIGSEWEWGDLDDWTDEQWREVVESEAHRTWVAYYRGSIAGYYELYRPDGTNTEIRYFGLANGAMGKGFGGALLGHAIESAWRWPGTKRVWVHTCTFDHPSALSNYQERGIVLFKEAITSVE